MSIFISISKESFLSDYWQKAPYVFRQAMIDVIDIVDGDELAGLACEESVESRIISGYQEAENVQEVSSQNSRPWQCQQGPFDEQKFSTLAEENWTLLVQGVDQWMDEARYIFSCFDFLPQWRLEDIMASYAPIGGGVGPHFDYYDVFLIQVSGSRQWRLGQGCDETTALQNNSQVKLLEQFITEETHELNPGDMIYIPAGKAHWGVASSDDCITLSVGFRAPSEKELLVSLLDQLTEKITSGIVEGASDNKRYRDTSSSIDEHPAKINSSVHQQLSQSLKVLQEMDFQAVINQSFGQLVTEQRYSHSDEFNEESLVDEHDLNQKLAIEGEIALFHPPYSRLAFSDKYLFVNGNAYPTCENFSRAICNGLIINPMIDSEMALLLNLLNRQEILLEEQGELSELSETDGQDE